MQEIEVGRKPRTNCFRDSLSSGLRNRPVCLPKIKIDEPVVGKHYPNGWDYVVQLIQSELHCDDGVIFISSVENEINEGRILAEPWIGFLHHQENGDLDRLFSSKAWRESAGHCLGLFVLSEFHRKLVQERVKTIPVARLYCPARETELQFVFEKFADNENKKILFIEDRSGASESFYKLQVNGFEKVSLNSNVLKWPLHVSDDKYDKLLEKNVVFLNLSGTSIDPVLVECIIRNTPIAVNRTGASVEYLGASYPLFYDTLEEAAKKLQDHELIRRTAEYLGDLSIKSKLTPHDFLGSLQNSAIYRSLPTPRSQQVDFKPRDVSVLILSYKRVYNLERLLSCFARQDFDGNFEIILWNNNRETLAEVESICEKFKHLLDLKVIHSSENFFCIPRMALTSLIKSELILLCDDDVIPAPEYISHFMKKHREYGRDAVLCARGHVFIPHTLNEEEPNRAWTTFEHFRFYDESETDRPVHYMHANSCLIPKPIMRKVLQYEMEREEFRLVDDYWFSYIFSHCLKVQVWKIKVDHIMSFTPCSEDPDIALFHNKRIREQYVNFYVYHMRKGWPWANALPA